MIRSTGRPCSDLFASCLNGEDAVDGTATSTCLCSCRADGESVGRLPRQDAVDHRRNYFAEVVLYEWEDVEIVLAQEDRVRFGSVNELARDVDLHGYYGGIRLVKATIKTFVEYCRGRHELHDRNFSIRYQTNIPRRSAWPVPVRSSWPRCVR